MHRAFGVGPAGDVAVLDRQRGDRAALLDEPPRADRGAAADRAAVLAADDEVGLAAALEVAVAGVEVALVVEHARAAVAELAAVDRVVVVVEGQEGQGRAAVLEQAVAVEDLGRGDLLLVPDADAEAGEVAEGLVLVADLGLEALLRRRGRSPPPPCRGRPSSGRRSGCRRRRCSRTCGRPPGRPRRAACRGRGRPPGSRPPGR